MNTRTKANCVADLYLWIALLVFPLFMWNGFLDIKESKAYFYLILTGIAFVLTAFLAGRQETNHFYIWKEHKFYLLFLAIGGVSTLLSTNPVDAFFGDYGRYNGLLTAIVYLACGSIVISYGRFSWKMIYGFEISGALVALLGVLNHYGLDLLHVYDKLRPKSAKMYLSTFGHVNIYTSFLAILLPVYAISFWVAKKKWQMIFHMALYMLGSLALLVSGSDSGYLALGTLWLLLVIRSIRTKRGRIRAGMVIAAFCIVVALVALISPAGSGKKKKMDSISKAILHLDFERVSDYFEFDDDWGNARGFIWNRGLSYYGELPVVKKAVGVGPDLLLPAMIDYCGEESLEKYDVYYDNMHCELFQILLTYGALGLLFLLLWTFRMLIRIWRCSQDDPLCLMVFMMLCCYGAQSMVNISTISVKGILVIFLFAALRGLDVSIDN